MSHRSEETDIGVLLNFWEQGQTLSKSENNNNELKKRLEESEAEKRDMQRKLKESEVAKKEHERTLDKWLEAVDMYLTAAKKHHESETQINELQEKLEQSESHNRELEKIEEAQKKELTKALEQIEAQKKQMERLNLDKKKATEDLLKQKKENEELRKSITALEDHKDHAEEVSEEDESHEDKIERVNKAWIEMYLNLEDKLERGETLMKEVQNKLVHSESQKRELEKIEEAQKKELKKALVQIEAQKKDLEQLIKQMERLNLDKRKATEDLLKQKKENEDLRKKITELEDHKYQAEKVLEKKGSEDKHDEIDEIRSKLKEKEEELVDFEALNNTLIIKEHKSNTELQEAREELIRGWESANRAFIRLKRMGDLDHQPFHRACKRKYPTEENQEIDVKAAELCSLWAEYIGDPSWHPFKVSTASFGHNKEIINEEDEKIKMLKNEFGAEVHLAVSTALLELNEYNPSGRYPLNELWNFKEERRASLKEAILHIMKQRKRRRT